MDNVNNTTFLLGPLIGVDINQHVSLMLYLGDYKKEPNVWGESLYATISRDDEELSKILRHKPNWKDSYFLDEHTEVHVFQLSSQEKQRIIYPFLSGKFSQIDRDYVEENFKEIKQTGTTSMGLPIYKKSLDYAILTKAKWVRDDWEFTLGMSLPEEAEVWSIPEKESEILNYDTSHTSTSPDAENVSDGQEDSITG